MGELISLETVRAVRGMPRARVKALPRPEHDEIDAILRRYNHNTLFSSKNANLRSLCTTFGTAIVRNCPGTPSWARFFFFRTPLDSRLYARLSHSPSSETWWMLDPDNGRAKKMAVPLGDRAQPIYSLPMSPFFRL